MAGGIGTALGIFDSAWSAMRCNNIATRGPACATARGESAGSPASSTAPPAKTTASSVSFACPAVRQASCISRSAATAPSTLPAGLIQPASSFAVSARARGPPAARYSGIGSRVLIRPRSGFKNRIRRRLPSISVSTVSSRNSAVRTRIYFSISASVIAPSPIARRPVKPVPTPKSIRPGANLFNEAKALAATAARRFDGISTPVPRRMRVVLIAATAMATNGSALSIWVSKNQAREKPNSSARRTNRQEAASVGMAIANCINRLRFLFHPGVTQSPSPASLRSAPLAHRRCATRQARARVRREGALRERGNPAQTGRVGEGFRSALSALRELEAAAGLALAVFLALDDAAVARQKALLLHQRPQRRLVIGQRLADAVPHRTGLTGQPAALDRAPNIELTEPVGSHERLVDQHAQHRPCEIDRAFAAVDVDFAVAGLDPHAGDRVLALAGGIRPAERVAPRLDIDRRHDRNRRRGRRPRLLQRLAQARQALEGLRAGALSLIVIGHRLRPLRSCGSVRRRRAGPVAAPRDDARVRRRP